MIKQTDDGGLKILDTFFGDQAKPTTLILELFVDANPLLDSDGGGSTRTLAAGGGYAEKDLMGWPYAVSNDTSGVPTITWEDLVFTFNDALSTTSKDIRGYAVFADNVLIFQEAISPAFTPVAGSTSMLVITPQYKLGNGMPA